MKRNSPNFLSQHVPSNLEMSTQHCRDKKKKKKLLKKSAKPISGVLPPQGGKLPGMWPEALEF
jgi:hypothetical protein